MNSVDKMSSFDASSVASLLREFAQRTALHAGNPFRAKAYARAADNLLALSLPLDRVIAEDRLRESLASALPSRTSSRGFIPLGPILRLKRCAWKSPQAFLRC